MWKILQRRREEKEVVKLGLVVVLLFILPGLFLSFSVALCTSAFLCMIVFLCIFLFLCIFVFLCIPVFLCSSVSLCFCVLFVLFDLTSQQYHCIVLNHPGRRTPAEESLCRRPRWMLRNANRYKYLRHIKESFEQKIKSSNLLNCFQMSYEEDGWWWQCEHVSFLKLFNVFIISVSFPKMFEWACKFLKLVKFSLIVWCYKHQLEQVSFLLLCCVDHHHNVHAKVFAWMQKLFSCWESLFHDLVVISSWWTKLIWSWLVSEFLSESLLQHLVQTFFKEPGQHPSDNFLCK